MNYTGINGANGYLNFNNPKLPSLKKEGNYIIRVVYTEADGSTVTVNYAVTFTCEVPTVSVNGAGKITVVGDYDKIRVVYVGEEGFDASNTEWADLKAAGMKYTDINGAKGYRDYQHLLLKKEGNYIIRLVYTLPDGSTAIVNYAVTYTPDAPAFTVDANGNITITDADCDATRVVYIGNEEFALEGSVWADLKEIGLNYPEVNGQRGYAYDVTLEVAGTYIIRLVYNQPDGANIAVNYAVTI